MPFTIDRYESRGLVAVRHYGHVEPGEIREIYDALFETRGDGQRLPGLIIDIRECVTYIAQDELFNALHEFHHRPRAARKTAFITDGKFLDEAAFIELTTGNRGITLKVFHDEPEAVRWLGVEPA